MSPPSWKRPAFGRNRSAHKADSSQQHHRKRGSLEMSGWPKYGFTSRRSSLETFAKYCPLVSAIFAPLSTLLDIPALTQHWYAKDGVSQPDIKASLILSAIGLALNVIANVLLVMRFSSKTTFWWRHSTRWSLISWIGKTVVAAVNLILFGILTRNSEGYTYVEGFWCAVVSIIDAGIISVTLLFHYYFAFGSEKHDNADIRSEGKRFMLSVTAFISILAIQSLVFSQIEGWLYSDGIYFSTQVALTIGYGDFAPVTTAGKVLVFPFSVLTISQLGNEIALIIGFISSRAERRRGKWRKRYEKAMHREANKMRPKASLTDEMALIHEINSREELMSQIYDLGWSAISLLVFWAIGATMFNRIEGWPFGDAVYSCMILSLTIGFGDYTPVRPAGKIVFIVYSLMAVPIVTSFAVTTITGLLSTYSDRGAAKEAFLAEQKRTPEAFAPHSDFVLRHEESYSGMRRRLLETHDQTSRDGDGGPGHDDNDNEIEKRPPEGPENGVTLGLGNLETGSGVINEEGHADNDRRESEVPEQQTSNEDTSAHVDLGASGEDGPDIDPSGLTMTGRRKPSPQHLTQAGHELTDRYDHMRHMMDEKKQEAEDWENDEIARHERKHDEETSSRGDHGEVEGEGGGGEGGREREESEQTKVGEPVAEDGREDDSRSLVGEKRVTFEESTEERQLELDLLKRLMRRIIQLEAEARQMLLDSMDNGVARTLLLADRNVQLRDVRSIRGDTADILSAWLDESELVKTDRRNASDQVDADHSGSGRPSGRTGTDIEAQANEGHSATWTANETSAEQAKGQLDMLSRVRRYRNTFAEILVVGSMLQKLEGEEKASFERWREDEAGAEAEVEVEGAIRKAKIGNANESTKDGHDENQGQGAGGHDQDQGAGGQGQDMGRVAEEKWGGLTGRIWRRYARKVREKDLAKWKWENV